MNKVTKQQWIDALKSGKYEQGKGFLKAKNTFCCLGVLCDLADPNAWQEEDDGGNSYNWNPPNKKYHTIDVDFPLQLMKKLFKVQTGVEELACDLSRLNDDGYAFESIAEIIDQMVKDK